MKKSLSFLGLLLCFVFIAIFSSLNIFVAPARAAGVPILGQYLTNGQVLVGSTGSAPVATAISALQQVVTSYSAVQVSTSFSPVNTTFMVINGTGTLTLESTPQIATTTAVSGQSITIMGGSNPVTFVDEGTLTGSLLELGAAGRALGAGDILKLRYYSGKWYEEGFVNN